MVNFGYGGLVGVLILVGDIWAIINILQSSVSNEKKLIWTIAVPRATLTRGIELEADRCVVVLGCGGRPR